MEFEYLDSKFHFGVVVEEDTVVLVLGNPPLELLDILSIQKCLASEFLLRLTAFNSDVKIW